LSLKITATVSWFGPQNKAGYGLLVEQPSYQYLGLICNESFTYRGLNSNLGHFDGSTSISLFRVENCICLSRGVQMTGATWWTVTRIVAGVADLVQRIRDGQAQIGYSVAGRLRDRVMLCVVCTVHKETRSMCF
jgi:hypothetical protein